MIIIGTAGWTIPASYKIWFPVKGTHLERYAERFHGVEINSPFYRSHKHSTYMRWAASVPDDFRFSVKLPRTVSHNHRLTGYGSLLDSFLAEVTGLGEKLSVILVQLPPTLAYQADVAAAFFRALTSARIAVACEPRHPSWFAADADQALQQMQVMRVAADPPRAPGDGVPGGETGQAYYRLHGSPRVYYSDYSDAALQTIASRLRPDDWCIFDNTAAFHAVGNALALTNAVSAHARTVRLSRHGE